MRITIWAAAVATASFSFGGCSNTSAVEEGARKTGRAATAAVETVDVKSALMTDRSVDASDIDVDTFPETKTIILSGTVKSAAQRDEAARIAAVEAPGYRIENRLTVVDAALGPYRKP